MACIRSCHLKTGYSVVPLLFIFCRLVRAWWPVPHMVVAELAWLQLSEEAKLYTTQQLGAFGPFFPHQTGTNGSSIWADVLPAKGLNIFESWHFERIPYVADEEEVASIHPQQDVHGAVWLLESCMETLTSGRANLWTRGLAMRLLIHILADIHQPLHCITRYSAAFRQGDRGGLDVAVDQTWVDSADNLHAFWDSGAGLFELIHVRGDPLDVDDSFTLKEDEVRAASQALYLELPPEGYSQAQIHQVNFTLWALESHKIALESAYVGSVWVALTSGKYKQSSDNSIALDASYVAHAEAVIKLRIALAAYRLATILNSLPRFKEGEGYDVECSPRGQAVSQRYGDRAAPLLATALGLMTAVALVLLTMVVRERERRRRLLAVVAAEVGADMVPLGSATELDQQWK